MKPEKKIRNLSKLNQICGKIKRNMAGCDFTICIFMAALNSYRVERNIRPFPPEFLLSNGEKNFTALRSACSKILPLKSLLRLPRHQVPHDMYDTVNFLFWLYYHSKFPMLTELPAARLPVIIRRQQYDDSDTLMPSYVFEVHFDEKIEKAWKDRINNREVIYAYHGSAMENFFSILKFGLQQNLTGNKDVLYGKGIYLSTDLSICANFAPFGQSWKHSMFGNKHSIIAVCQVINDANEVKCHDKKIKPKPIVTSGYGELPQKYLIVTNSDLVRLKYLLVYKRDSTQFVKSFLAKHGFWVVISLYFIFIIYLGYRNNRNWQVFVRNLFQFY